MDNKIEDFNLKVKDVGYIGNNYHYQMKLIGTNEELIPYLFKEKIYLLDSSIDSIKISGDSAGNVHIDIFLLNRNNVRILLSFKNVIEYSFYHNNKYRFYFVESLKFFWAEDKVYLSLDPYGETPIISDQDNDFILAPSVEGYIEEI